jgi:hypothetical protein
MKKNRRKPKFALGFYTNNREFGNFSQTTVFPVATRKPMYFPLPNPENPS